MSEEKTMKKMRSTARGKHFGYADVTYIVRFHRKPSRH
jgi:hypothetical protein